MNPKLKKFLGVLILSLLIWWWAFSAQVESVSLTGTLEKDAKTDPSLLVTFMGPSSASPQRLIVLRALSLSSAPSKIADLRKRMRLPQHHPDVEKLDFYYMPQEPGNFTLNLREYLRQSSKMKDLALTLDSCEPSQLTVNVEQLQEKQLSILVVDENGFAVKGATTEPAWINMYVRSSYNDPALVKLSSQQIQTSRERPVSAKPYVELGVAGIVREADAAVQVTVAGGQLLDSKPFQPQTIGFIMSGEIAGKYTVQLTNEADLKSRVLIRATEAALAEYQKRPYHILIEVKPGDERLPEVPPRPVVYNFPRDFVRKGEIELADTAPEKTAVFKLVPINGAVAP